MDTLTAVGALVVDMPAVVGGSHHGHVAVEGGEGWARASRYTAGRTSCR